MLQQSRQMLWNKHVSLSEKKGVTDRVWKRLAVADTALRYFTYSYIGLVKSKLSDNARYVELTR